eukprot:Sspe_Gene.111447::Locus_93529_Transcript_1_1_Confidence_1.000_Length_1044::g.111447::m.111447
MSNWFGAAFESIKKQADQVTGQALQLTEQAKNLGAQLKSQLEEQSDLKKAFELDERYCAKKESVSDPPWDVVPEGWTGREKEWHLLITSLPLDPNCFLVAPRDPSTLSDSEEAMLKACGMYEVLQFGFTDEEYEQSIPQARAAATDPAMVDIRLKLVPKWVSERDFWRNYFWKVRELGRCCDLSKVRVVLTVMNSDPDPYPIDDPSTDKKRRKNQGLLQGDDKIQEILGKVEEEEKARQWVEGMVKQIDDEVRCCNDNVVLIRRVQQRANTTSPELRESVYESCKYHKQKVASLLGQLDGMPMEKRGEALGPESDLVKKLVAVNEQL